MSQIRKVELMNTKRKISKQQYERAKRMVSEYETQFSLFVVSRSFTVDDLWILSGTIAIPSLTIEVVDKDFASQLQGKLEDKGYSIDYVSLCDMGHISVRYRGSRYQQMTDKHIEDLLSVLNDG
jgi:hypothetical protein